MKEDLWENALRSLQYSQYFTHALMKVKPLMPGHTKTTQHLLGSVHTCDRVSTSRQTTLHFSHHMDPRWITH